MSRLAKLEAQIEQWIEGSLSRLLAGRLQAREVAVRLARAMEDHALPGASGERLAPTRYQIRLHPDDAAALQTDSPDLLKSLTSELLIFARELDLTFTAPPTIALEPDSTVEPNGVVVAAASDPKNETRPMPALPAVELASMLHSPKAYLIVEGDKHVPLTRAVITLGRRLDNTIILDDPRVSRHHAQLRQRYGRWVLYDLGSASGTFVNNHRIDECMLRAGDVISLAGVMIIYGEEEQTDAADDTGHTAPLANHPTSVEPRLKDE